MKQYKEGSCMDDTWLLPILAILGSGLSMVATGILLAYYNNQPIFDWNGVTINAIIAIFSAISKAMLAFSLSECLGQAKWIWFSWKGRPLSDIDLIDAGSRGPMGSFKILGQPVACSFISMGAIIVILSAAIDPFVQLTVGKRDILKFENNSNVQIAYAERYSKGSLNTIAATRISSPDGNNYSATITDADFGMKSAVFYGLSQPDSLISQQTQFFCSSGNCTWDTFTSLAVCSRCTDLTNQIEKKDLGMTNPLSVLLDPTNSGLVVGQVTEYRLPNGLNGDRSVLLTAYGTGNEAKSVSFTSHDTLIWSMTMMNFTSLKVSAIECGLWYCVNSYKSTVKNGILTEIINPIPSKREPDSWRPVPGPSTSGVAVLPPNTINYDGISSSVERTDLQLGKRFNLSRAAIYSISDLMSTTFTIKLNQKGINAYVIPTDGTTYGPMAMQRLYNSQNLEATFASLAKSMTNNIRQNSDKETVANGKEGKYLVLIQVRVWFLTLPIILIVGAAAFLAIVWHYTHKSKFAVWGTNALPIVALGGKMGPVFNANDMRVSKMEEAAKRQLVQFPTLEQRHDFGTANTTSQYGDYEMISPLRTTMQQNPSTNVVSDVSDETSLVEGRQQHVIPWPVLQSTGHL